MKKLSLLIALFAIAIGACSQRTAYQGLQRQHQQQCDRSAIEDERNRCTTEDKLSYDDYKREREALLSGKTPGHARHDYAAY